MTSRLHAWEAVPETQSLPTPRRESHNSQRSPTAIWKLNIICQRFAIISLPTSHSSNKLSFARFGVCSPPPERWKAFATRLKHSYPSQSSLSSKNKAVFGYKIYSPAMKMMSTLTQQVDLVGNTFALISISKNKQKSTLGCRSINQTTSLPFIARNKQFAYRLVGGWAHFAVKRLITRPFNLGVVGDQSNKLPRPPPL